MLGYGPLAFNQELQGAYTFPIADDSQSTDLFAG